MEMIRQLSKQESEEYQKMLCLLPSDQATQELCLNYFISFKSHMGYISNDKLPIALKCAYFIAQKSQYVYNMKGEKVKNIGLSLNHLLKTHKLDDIMITLKEFCKKVKIPDQQAQTDLNGIVKEISFLITFHSKFQRVIQKLELRERHGQTNDYSKTFTSFVWLLYVQTKNKVLHRSLQLIQNTCLLAQTIAFMLIYSWEYIRPSSFMRGDRKLTDESSWKQVCLLVKEKILEIFLIKNMEVYIYIAKSFETSFQQMIDGGVIKVSPNKVDFSSPDLISSNYKRLDHSYQKCLSPHDLDERIFFKERSTNLTPSKFTPFARQGYTNKLTKTKLGSKFDNKENNLTSHRILTYDMIDKNEEISTSNLPQMKLPKSVMQSPSTIKVPLICSTPISNGMQMYNYLNEKAKRATGKSVDSQIEELLNEILEGDRKDMDRSSRILKKSLIQSIYTIAKDEYFTQNSSDVNNLPMKVSILGLSIQLVFFVCNIDFSFTQIQQRLQITIFEEWKACDFFLKFDKSMPSTLKLHLLDLQITILTQKVWTNRPILNALQGCASDDTTISSSMHRLFKRILHQIAYQITQLTQSLKIEDRLSQIIFETMKEIILSHTDMLWNRHIDQMIICSIYANCKVGHLDLKFNEIKQVYAECNPHNKVHHEQLMCKVFMDGNSSVDIINFYNSVFIGRLKHFITSFKDKNYNPCQSRKSLTMRTNLREVIPRDITFKQVKKYSGNGLNKPNNTPSSSLLYAYNESPILKYQMSSFRGPLISKKVINFDEEEEKLCKNQDKFCGVEDNFMETTDFISKKFNKKNIQKPTNLLSPTLTNNHKVQTYFIKQFGQKN